MESARATSVRRRSPRAVVAPCRSRMRRRPAVAMPAAASGSARIDRMASPSSSGPHRYPPASEVAGDHLEVRGVRTDDRVARARPVRSSLPPRSTNVRPTTTRSASPSLSKLADRVEEELVGPDLGRLGSGGAQPSRSRAASSNHSGSAQSWTLLGDRVPEESLPGSGAPATTSGRVRSMPIASARASAPSTESAIRAVSHFMLPVTVIRSGSTPTRAEPTGVVSSWAATRRAVGRATRRWVRADGIGRSCVHQALTTATGMSRRRHSARKFATRADEPDRVGPDAIEQPPTSLESGGTDDGAPIGEEPFGPFGSRVGHGRDHARSRACLVEVVHQQVGRVDLPHRDGVEKHPRPIRLGKAIASSEAARPVGAMLAGPDHPVIQIVRREGGGVQARSRGGARVNPRRRAEVAKKAGHEVGGATP